jgi:hypothetical protein
MMPDISDRLSALLCNLAEAIPLEEMKFQCLLLIRSELLSQATPNRFPIKRVCGRLPNRGGYPLFVDLFRAIVLPKIQIAPPVDRPMVRHLHDPGSPGTLLGIEVLRSLGEIEKHFLAKVIRFGLISKDSPGDMEHGTGVPAE